MRGERERNEGAISPPFAFSFDGGPGQRDVYKKPECWYRTAATDWMFYIDKIYYGIAENVLTEMVKKS